MLALLQAVKEGYVKGVKELINSGGILGLNTNEMGTTPLIEACKFSNKDIAKRMIKVLLKHGANVNHRDKEGRNALHWISMTGDKHLINLVVESQSSVDFISTDRQGNSILFYAVQTGKCSFVRHICKLYKLNSVRDRGKNRSGISAADLALKLGHKKCAEMCKEVIIADNRELGPVLRNGRTTCVNDLNEQVVLPPIQNHHIEEVYKPGQAVPKVSSKKTKGNNNVSLEVTSFHPQIRRESAQSEEIIGMIDYKIVLSDLNWMQAIESTSSYRTGVDEKERLEKIRNNPHYKSVSQAGFIRRKDPSTKMSRVRADKTHWKNGECAPAKVKKGTRLKDDTHKSKRV